MPPDLPPDTLRLAIRCLREIADRKYDEPADNQERDAGHWARAHALFALHQLDAIEPGVTGEPPRHGAMRGLGLTNAQKREAAAELKRRGGQPGWRRRKPPAE